MALAAAWNSDVNGASTAPSGWRKAPTVRILDGRLQSVYMDGAIEHNVGAPGRHRSTESERGKRAEIGPASVASINSYCLS